MRGSPAGAILRVDKPEGPTSHDVVAAARRALDTRRIGHTGTLDPFASGLLLLCIGPATRLSPYLTELKKRYVGVMRLGVATDTDDRTGAVTGSSEEWRRRSEEQVAEALRQQQGEILQVPPAYSAKRVRGERMHRRVRRGETVTLDPVPVVIDRIGIRSLDPPDVEFEVECSTGTYVRAIARDVGEELGTGAHLTRLRRERIGAHDVEDAVSMARLDDEGAVQRASLGPLDGLEHLPRLDVDDDAVAALGQGAPVAAPDDGPEDGAVAVVYGGRLLAVAEIMRGLVQPRKVFAGGD